MNIPSVNSSSNQPTFGYTTILSKLYKKGKLPSVTHDLYGRELTLKNCSNEHLIPHSKGGKTNLSNIALADKFINMLRGSDDIRDYLTLDMIRKYLAQFIGVKIKHGKEIIFDGNDYIKNLIPTFEKLGFKF